MDIEKIKILIRLDTLSEIKRFVDSELATRINKINQARFESNLSQIELDMMAKEQSEIENFGNAILNMLNTEIRKHSI